MPSIPGSGPISMSMFNTVVGRASNTSNSKLAGGSTITTDSLFYLASVSGSINTTAPHQMSEWYNYTTSPSNVDIKIYIKYGNLPEGETTSNFGFYYASSSDGTTYSGDNLIVGGSSISTTCNNWSISPPSNYYGAFGFRTTNVGKGAYGVYFTGTKTGGDCPAQAQDYCGTKTIGFSPYITNWSTSGFNIYFTIYVTPSDPPTFVIC